MTDEFEFAMYDLIVIAMGKLLQEYKTSDVVPEQLSLLERAKVLIDSANSSRKPALKGILIIPHDSSTGCIYLGVEKR